MLIKNKESYYAQETILKEERMRELTRVHTRKLDRAVAHKTMKKAGMKHVNKHDHYGPLYQRVRTDSVFSQRWREYV